MSTGQLTIRVTETDRQILKRGKDQLREDDLPFEWEGNEITFELVEPEDGEIEDISCQKFAKRCLAEGLHNLPSFCAEALLRHRKPKEWQKFSLVFLGDANLSRFLSGSILGVSVVYLEYRGGRWKLDSDWWGPGFIKNPRVVVLSST